ncbi:MFS transporter [Streptomyces sp. N35]|uniref:MFS transporter n=1 Tax=Streptomyces sp. N35 TaxID=2795730 RepID=UPI0018F311DD|nr:MFS transporter [Streptomyces sp. N35]
MGAVGAALGTVAGGLLTEAFGRRSIFLINLPVGAAALLFVGRLLPADERGRDRAAGRLDLPGAVLGTSGLLLLGYAIGAFAAPATLIPTLVALSVALVLLAAFVAVQARSTAPLMPLRLLGVRQVSGSAVASALVGAVHVPTFVLLTLYLQNTQDYSPVRSGLAVLPVALAAPVASRTALPVLAERFGAHSLLWAGLALQAAALAWFATVPATVHYATDILPAALLLGVGLPASFIGVTAPAVTAVDQADTGVTAGIVNTAQRIGSGLGVAALLLANYVTGTTGHLAGLRTAFAAATGLALLGCLLALLLLRPKSPVSASVRPAPAVPVRR